MPKIMRSQLPYVFAQKQPATKDGKPVMNEKTGKQVEWTNFYVMLPTGKYVRIRPAYIGTKEKPDNRDMQRMLDSIPVVTSIEDIIEG